MVPDPNTPDTRRLWLDVFGGLACLVGIIASIGGVGMLVAGLIHWRGEGRFHQEGVQATPRLTAKDWEKVWVDEEGWQINHWIHYEYRDHQDNTHRTKKYWKQEAWDRSNVGDQLPAIEYVRSEPSRHRAVADDGRWRGNLQAGGWILGVSLPFLALGWFLRPK